MNLFTILLIVFFFLLFCFVLSGIANYIDTKNMKSVKRKNEKPLIFYETHETQIKDRILTKYNQNKI